MIKLILTEFNVYRSSEGDVIKQVPREQTHFLYDNKYVSDEYANTLIDTGLETENAMSFTTKQYEFIKKNILNKD